MRDNYLRFRENNVLGIIYINFRGGGGHGSPAIFVFIIHKDRKITRA